MKKILYLLTILMIFSKVFAANILTYNVYSREDRLDVVLGFDAPFNGKITQKPYNLPFYTLVFDNLAYEGIVDRNLNATLADAMQISSKGNQTFITFKSTKNLDLNAIFLNKEKFGIRIRLTPKQKSQQANTPQYSNLSQQNPPIQPLQNNSSIVFDDMSLKYIAMVGILLLLIIILLFIKKRVNKGGIFKINNRNLHIKYERYLDKSNRFMVLEYNKKSYVVIVGNTNLLLDKQGVLTSNDDESFEAYFEENKAKINSMLEEKKKEFSSKNNEKAFNVYKNKLDAQILNR